MKELDRDLLDHVDTAVFAIEPDDAGVPRFAAFNRAAARALGRPQNEVIGLTALEVFGGRLGQIAYDHHVAALAEATARTYEILLPVRRTERLVRTMLSPVEDAYGGMLRLIGTTTDISGEYWLRGMQTEMQTISDEMENYVNLVAHDLRAPMRNLKAIAQMLREGVGDTSGTLLHLIDMLEEIGEKTTTLVGDVLSSAELGAGMVADVEFDLTAAIREIMVLLDPMREVQVSHSNATIRGDRTALQIVLRNLIDNAIKHAMPDNGKEQLTLSIIVRQSSEEMIEVSVRDNGRGFAQPSLLFLNTGDLRTGSGFGLIGVRRLIRARGGTIMASGTGGEGADVTFSLPGRLVNQRMGYIAA